MFGPGGISPMQLLIVLAIVILIFGTAKLKNFGADLGGAFKGFKKAMSEDDEDKPESSSEQTRQIESNGEPDAEFSEQAEKEKQS